MKYAIYVKGTRGYNVLLSICEDELCPNPSYVILEQPDDDIAKIASRNKLSFMVQSRPQAADHIRFMASEQFDLIVAVGYSKIIPIEIIKSAHHGGINCHAGKLPNYRGTAVIPWQIINGETQGEAYVLNMTEKIDDGKILASEPYDILPSDTAYEVSNKVNDIFNKLVPYVIYNFDNDIVPSMIDQAKGVPTTWTCRKPEDGLILWKSMYAEEVINLVRALTIPYPGAFTIINNKKIFVNKAIINPLMLKGVSGRFVGNRGGYPTIIAKDYGVAITNCYIYDKLIIPSFFPAKYGCDCQYDLGGSI